MNILLIVIILVIIVLIFMIFRHMEQFNSVSSKKCKYYYQFGDTVEHSIKQYVNKERQLDENLVYKDQNKTDMADKLNTCLTDCGLTKYDYNLKKCEKIITCANVIDFKKNILKTHASKPSFKYVNYKDNNYEDCIKKCNSTTNCDTETCKIKCEQVKRCNFDPTQKFRHIYDCIDTCQQTKRNDGTPCSEIQNDSDYCKKVCTNCGDDCGYKDKCDTKEGAIQIKNNVKYSRDGTKAKISWCINKSKITKPVEFILVLRTNNLDDGDKINTVQGTWDSNYEYILKNLTPDNEYILTVHYKKLDIPIDPDNELEILGTSNELKFTPKKKKINSMYLLDSIAQDTKPNIAASYNYCNI